MILEIDGGYSGIRFSACHFIPRHEKCSRLHGHSYIMRLRLEGDVGEDGMLMDFVVLKKELKAIASVFDHRTILPSESQDVSLSITEDSVEAVTCGKRYVFPLRTRLFWNSPIRPRRRWQNSWFRFSSET